MPRYVALFRGLNVGGKNPISMTDLRSVFERAGHTGVRTLFNTGNVVFDASGSSVARLTKDLTAAVSERFTLDTRLLVLTGAAVQKVAAAIPDAWLDTSHSSCNVMFLMPERAKAASVDLLLVDPTIEDVHYVAGAIISRVDVKRVGRSSVHRLIDTDLYPAVTLRRGSITKKLAELVAP